MGSGRTSQTHGLPAVVSGVAGEPAGAARLRAALIP
jgi:hypothetical protein